MNARKETSAQQKMEAWQLVAKLCAQAQAALVQVNEGPYELVQLHWVENKARVQVTLWNEGGK